MRKQKFKRVISALLAFVLSLSGMISYLPAYAEEEAETFTVGAEEDDQEAEAAAEDGTAEETAAEPETEPADPQKYNLTLLYNEAIGFTYDNTKLDHQDEESKNIILSY